MIENESREFLDTVNRYVAYDPETGRFTWKIRLGRCAPGSVAGGLNSKGYVQIGIERRKYLAHRLAWLITHSRWPSDQIDHVNRNPCDNRIDNLREATNVQNSANRRARNSAY